MGRWSLWDHYRTAKQFGTKPSNLLGLSSPHDAWLAYQYDMTCGRLGLWVEAMLSQTTKDGRQRYSLVGLLADNDKVFAHQYRTDFDSIPWDSTAVA